ncbi:MAG: acetyl-CoA C-acetyltransferase [Dehalococcoidia bacterium]
MEDAVIVSYLRTPFSRARPREPERDAFNSIRMDDMAARLIQEMIKQTGINPEEIGDVLTGTAMPVLEQWLYGGKSINFLAKLPFSVAAQGIDRQCVSSMSTIHQGAMEIMLGYSDIVISCGIEHMTHIPTLGGGGRQVPIEPNPKFITEEFKDLDIMTTMNMGLTAEKLAAEAGFTREEMDKWSLRSHQMAAKAVAEGFFKEEVLPVEAAQADGTNKVFDRDLSIRGDTSMEALAQLNPSFKPDGVITAGNSSPLNAGASAVMLMSKKKAQKHNLKPLAKIVSMGWAGVDPTVMGKGPVPSSRKALEHAGLKAKDIDLWEINEAFAVVTLYAIRELGIDPNKVNVKGGAVAIGHPLGASGSRLVGTLARILNIEKGKYGLATACVGGGQGAATILERED